MSRVALVDVTELFHNPVRTGIQRVVRTLLRHWPDGHQVQLCRFVPDVGLRLLPDRVAVLLTDADPVTRGMDAREIGTMAAQAAEADTRPAPDGVPILVPEVFFDMGRSLYYRWIAATAPRRVAFLAFDFIPWLQPELIGVRESAPLMHYLRLLRDSARVGFISARTRDLYRTRITRNPAADGPVFALGGDWGNVARQQWSPDRDAMLCIGSIDGRKNQDVVLDGFERLWTEGSQMRLVMVGRVFTNGHVAALGERVRALAAREPRFEHHVDITDAALAALYPRARGTIYVSQSEGYGLPPVEGLACGVPAVVAADLPSIADLPAKGQIRLPSVTPDTVANALRAMEDNEKTAMLWAEAATLDVPTWAGVARQVADWVHSP